MPLFHLCLLDELTFGYIWPGSGLSVGWTYLRLHPTWFWSSSLMRNNSLLALIEEENHTTKHDLRFFFLIKTKNMVLETGVLFAAALEIEFWPPLLKQRTWYFAFVRWLKLKPEASRSRGIFSFSPASESCGPLGHVWIGLEILGTVRARFPIEEYRMSRVLNEVYLRNFFKDGCNFSRRI